MAAMALWNGSADGRCWCCCCGCSGEGVCCDGGDSGGRGGGGGGSGGGGGEGGVEGEENCGDEVIGVMSFAS